MANIVKVGMADLNVCKSPDGITTLGLGSCVGICIRDPIAKVGGMAHAMLPDSKQIENNSNRAKFADTGIEDLVKRYWQWVAEKEDWKQKSQVEHKCLHFRINRIWYVSENEMWRPARKN